MEDFNSPKFYNLPYSSDFAVSSWSRRHSSFMNLSVLVRRNSKPVQLNDRTAVIVGEDDASAGVDDCSHGGGVVLV